MRRPVALEHLVEWSPDPNLDAAVCLAVALGARAAHEVADDVGEALPTIWASLRRLIEAGYVSPPHCIVGLSPTRKGETVARAVYDVRTHAFVPPVAAEERATLRAARHAAQPQPQPEPPAAA